MNSVSSAKDSFSRNYSSKRMVLQPLFHLQHLGKKSKLVCVTSKGHKKRWRLCAACEGITLSENQWKGNWQRQRAMLLPSYAIDLYVSGGRRRNKQGKRLRWMEIAPSITAPKYFRLSLWGTYRVFPNIYSLLGSSLFENSANNFCHWC